MDSSRDLKNRRLYCVGRVVIDKSFHTQNADEGFFRFFGNGVIYSIRRTVEESDFPRLEACIAGAETDTVRSTAVRMRSRSGELRWMLVSVKKLSYDLEETLYSLDLSDILSLEELSAACRSAADNYRMILSLLNELAFEYSFETKRIRIFMFDSCREITLTDCLLSEWIEESLGLIPQRCRETFDRLCDDIQTGAFRFDHELDAGFLTDGKSRETCLFRGATLYTDPESRRVMGTISIMSSRQKAKSANPAVESNLDSLSGLLNKRAVTDYARRLIESKPRHNVNIVIIDIDDFTGINSSYGHLFGDEVLCAVADIVSDAVGDRGVAGRQSGGGFLAVIENTADETDLRGILRAIRTNTEWALADRFEDFRLTCSIGASSYPKDSLDFDDLFMQADKALYLANEKGRNRYVIYDIEKHGPVEKDMKNKIAFLSSKKDSSEKLAFFGKIVDSLVSGKLPDTIVLLEQLRALFGIDDIRVFAGNGMKLILSCGNAVGIDASYIYSNGYTERFSGDGIFVIDNVNELEGRDDNAMERLTAQNTGGAVQYLITDGSLIKGMVSFCYIGRFKKWSVSDTNYLTLAARMISAILKKNLYI